MSIALEGRARIGGSGFVQGLASFPSYDAAAAVAAAAAAAAAVAPPQQRRSSPEVEEEAAGRCSSSSIGRESDVSSAAEEGEEREVQSSYKNPLDALDALEESLPIRRGISKFYCGKSKSFTTLTDAASSSTSAKDLAKPANAYTRKRKNLLAFSIMYNKPRYEASMMSTEGSVAKRAASSSRSTLSPLARSSSGVSSSCSSEEEEHESVPRQLPPLHPNGRASAAAAATTCASPIASSPAETPSFPLRSFSLNDLRGAVGSSSSIRPRVKHKRD